MKRQYLGDSKDSFKWDYHDHLASELRYARLTVALMLTRDDGRGHGQTRADWFPAREAVLRFCHDVKRTRDIERIETLPAHTGASYRLALHNGDARPLNRTEYFSGFDPGLDQIVFVDPDNGFEPERSCQEQHVSYRDVARILDQLNENSILTVFHHFRRITFRDDFARIRVRLGSCCSAAIYWHSLMFVCVARSRRAIDAVIDVNRAYATRNPVEVIL